MSEIVKLYEEAIELSEQWRLGNRAFSIQKASPNELHLYNLFTSLRNNLGSHLACIKDAQGTYTKDKK